MDHDFRLAIEHAFQRPELSPHGRRVGRGRADEPDAGETVQVEVDLVETGAHGRRSQGRVGHRLAAS
jgi:hypothetical protein